MVSVIRSCFCKSRASAMTRESVFADIMIRAPAVIYATAGNKTLEAEALKWGEKMRDVAFGKIKERHS